MAKRALPVPIREPESSRFRRERIPRGTVLQGERTSDPVRPSPFDSPHRVSARFPPKNQTIDGANRSKASRELVQALPAIKTLRSVKVVAAYANATAETIDRSNRRNFLEVRGDVPAFVQPVLDNIEHRQRQDRSGCARSECPSVRLAKDHDRNWRGAIERQPRRRGVIGGQ